MARLPRLYLEGCPQHIIQRGNNREVCFYSDEDYAFYLQKLKEAAEKYGVAVHAFVLMTNHVHLLVTPQGPNSISRVMQSLGRSYVRYINITYKRTGTLWEGRFKSCIVDSDTYFFTLCRYIELNPVRAGMVSHPGEYPWSSFRFNAMGVPIQLISEHTQYLELGVTKASRLVAYRKLFKDVLDEKLLDEVRLCTNKEWVIGSEAFRKQIESAHQRKALHLPWGGDRRSKKFRQKKPL